jgi:multiple sugar transport system ATP-binding protein
MNFIPCRLESAGGDDLAIRLADDLLLPVPKGRAARYRPHVGKENLLLGLRPEHIVEARDHQGPGFAPFRAQLDVTEPMGMETLVYFNINGSQVCGRVSPNSGARENSAMQMAAELDAMHLIDQQTGLVI